ncbi:hypothetical protein ACOMHN_034198 [Nucella lapillus]
MNAATAQAHSQATSHKLVPPPTAPRHNMAAGSLWGWKKAPGPRSPSVYPTMAGCRWPAPAAVLVPNCNGHSVPRETSATWAGGTRRTDNNLSSIQRKDCSG